jgi:hypothetical protein
VSGDDNGFMAALERESKVNEMCEEALRIIKAQQAEIERLRAERDAERALADQLADVLRIIVRDWCPSTVRVPILAAHAAARNGSASATDVGGPS